MQTITYEEYLEKHFSLPIIDVRSPLEFSQGHIPNAINYPLLNDEERKIVGTIYKQEGHKSAVIKGFELVGGKFASYISSFEKIVSQPEIVVHCWRGGLRSNIMTWLLEKGGFKPLLLKGGYKFYRNWVQTTMCEKRKLIVLGGKTGSGKTKILHLLKQKGETIIDLEGIANHRGSAFGGVGLGTQPSQEQFENELANYWNKFKNADSIWIENESRLIGKAILPQSIIDNMKSASVVDLLVNKEERIKNILAEYGSFEKKLLIEKTLEIEKKLGNENMRKSISALLDNDYVAWASYLLNYYDKAYEFSKQKRNTALYFSFAFSDSKNMNELIEFKKQLI